MLFMVWEQRVVTAPPKRIGFAAAMCCLKCLSNVCSPVMAAHKFPQHKEKHQNVQLSHHKHFVVKFAQQHQTSLSRWQHRQEIMLQAIPEAGQSYTRPKRGHQQSETCIAAPAGLHTAYCMYCHKPTLEPRTAANLSFSDTCYT